MINKTKRAVAIAFILRKKAEIETIRFIELFNWKNIPSSDTDVKSALSLLDSELTYNSLWIFMKDGSTKTFNI